MVDAILFLALLAIFHFSEFALAAAFNRDSLSWQCEHAAMRLQPPGAPAAGARRPGRPLACSAALQ
jgi:hypothetical protein